MLNDVPRWIAVLDAEDLTFLRRFLLASGSLKAMAEQYAVSYPTIRARLDRLIMKVLSAEQPEPADAMERLVQILEREGILSHGTAQSLVLAHQRVLSDLRSTIPPAPGAV